MTDEVELTDEGQVQDNNAPSKQAEDNEVIWGEELQGLGDGNDDTDWFTPPQGITKLRVLNFDGKNEINYGSEEEPDWAEKGFFDVEIIESNGEYDEGDELKWSVTVSETVSGLWGQLAKLGAHKDGLEGEEVTLIAQGKAGTTNRDYTVQEAANL